MSRYLDTATNVALIVVCVLISIVLGQRLWLQFVPPAVAPPVQYQAGDTFPAIEQVDYGRRANTVVLFVASTCKYCTQSMPFYATLAQHRSNQNYQIIAIGFETEEVIAAYFKAHDITPDAVATLKAGFKFAATPTVVVLDRQGKVVRGWIGALGSSESEVAALLNIPLSVGASQQKQS